MINFRITPDAVRFLCPLDGTQIILQRHCDYDLEKEILIPESANYQKEIYKNLTQEIYNSLSKTQLENIYFLFLASPSSNDNFQRAKDSVAIAKNIIESYFPSKQILNNDLKIQNTEKILMHYKLAESKMFTSDKAYLDFLTTKTTGKLNNIFNTFENDIYEKERKKMKAEGPKEIVDRINNTILALERYSCYFHSKHKNSQLVIIADTHSDTLSPYIKKICNIKNRPPIPIDYCGAISIVINKSGEKVAIINNKYIELTAQEISKQDNISMQK